MKHLVIDGMNLLHRARSGFKLGPAPIMFNFFRTLRAQVELHKPQRVYFVLEGHPKATFALLPEYKGNRRVGLDDLAQAELDRFFESVKDIMNVMSHMPITVIKHPDYECDDTAHNIALKALSASTPGVKVKMSQGLKDAFMKECTPEVHKGPFMDDEPCMSCSLDHVKEFGESEGIVQGFTDWGSGTFGPEVDVRWQPDNLRYCYDPLLLDVVDEATILSSDSDFVQSLQSAPGVKLYNAMKKEYVTAPDYDYVMWKALRGDGTDNIPGIPGVGDKTATKLVTSHLHKDLTEFLCKDPERGRVYDRNTTLIRFQTFSDKDWEGVVKHTGVTNWDEVKRVFDSHGFASITNEKSWQKFTATFDKAGK